MLKYRLFCVSGDYTVAVRGAKGLTADRESEVLERRAIRTAPDPLP